MSKDKDFVTREYFDKGLKGLEQRLIKAMRTMMEIRDEELQGAHEDELDVVAGEKVAPTPWKSIPRRLKMAEVEIEHIKDRLNS